MIPLSYLFVNILLLLPGVQSSLLIDKSILNVLKNFKQVNRQDCLVILMGEWTADESHLIQTTLSTTGFLHLDGAMPRMPTMLNHPCQIAMLKSPKFLTPADQLCQLDIKSNCISILFSGYRGGGVTPAPDTALSTTLIMVRLHYPPQFRFTVQSFYSLWDPQCGVMYNNVLIHRTGNLFRNKVGIKMIVH